MELKYCDIIAEFDRWQTISKLSIDNVVLKQSIEISIDDLDEEFLRELNHEIKIYVENDPMTEEE